jgi:hypothetical protein
VLAALKDFKVSMGKEDLQKMKEWTEEFGSVGA